MRSDNEVSQLRSMTLTRFFFKELAGDGSGRGVVGGGGTPHCIQRRSE